MCRACAEEPEHWRGLDHNHLLKALDLFPPSMQSSLRHHWQPQHTDRDDILMGQYISAITVTKHDDKLTWADCGSLTTVFYILLWLAMCDVHVIYRKKFWISCAPNRRSCRRSASCFSFSKASFTSCDKEIKHDFTHAIFHRSTLRQTVSLMTRSTHCRTFWRYLLSQSFEWMSV